MKIILIGTSPAMLMQALLLSNKYKDIQIHEKSHRIGGSWFASKFYSTKKIETSTHIYAPWKSSNLYRRSLKILERILNIKLIKTIPKPVRIINKNISKKELKKITHFHVKKGATHIVSILEKLLKKKKIEIIYNSYIRKIKLLNNNKKKLFTGNNKIIYADKVYLPCFIDLKDFFYIRGKKFSTKFHNKDSYHFFS